MQEVVEVVKFTVPGILVLVAAMMIFKEAARRQEIIERGKIRMNSFSTFLPLKLSAHERAILYLERIDLASLIPRCEPMNKNATQFKNQLFFEIDVEYEHNIVQQLYISDRSWNALKAARNEVKAIIQVAYDKLPSKAGGIDLAQAIAALMKAREEQESGSELALNLAVKLLKSDIVQIFG